MRDPQLEGIVLGQIEATRDFNLLHAVKRGFCNGSWIAVRMPDGSVGLQLTEIGQAQAEATGARLQ